MQSEVFCTGVFEVEPAVAEHVHALGENSRAAALIAMQFCVIRIAAPETFAQ